MTLYPTLTVRLDDDNIIYDEPKPHLFAGEYDDSDGDFSISLYDDRLLWIFDKGYTIDVTLDMDGTQLKFSLNKDGLV